MDQEAISAIYLFKHLPGSCKFLLILTVFKLHLSITIKVPHQLSMNITSVHEQHRQLS